MTEQKVDALSRIISTLIPATVAECARRFNDLRAFSAKPSQLMTLVEKVSGDLVSECDFDVDDTEETPPTHEPNDHAQDPKLAQLGAYDLGHIQNLKLDLHDLYKELKRELKKEIAEEFKDSIKSELRMEMFMEIEKLKANLKENLKERPHKTTPPGGMPEFSIDFTPENDIKPVFKGFDSIAGHHSFNAQSRGDVEADLLANNPIFARVTRGLERSRRGEAAYTPDELIEARGDRFDTTHLDVFKESVANYKPDYETPEDAAEDTAEDERWNKLLRDKHASSM